MSTERDSTRGTERGTVSRRRDLARLCEGVLTGIARIRGRRQSVGQAASFRGKMQQALHSIRREAARYGYDSAEVDDVEFAIVAFLDETILTSNDPAAADWREATFQQEKYGIANAGEKFFDRLDTRMQRQDSAELGDVLEVYLICLLLGFEGQHSGQTGTELRQITADVLERVRRISGLERQLSPEGELTVAAKGPQASRFDRRSILSVCAITAAAVCVMWLGAWLHLGAIAEGLARSILETQVPGQPTAQLFVDAPGGLRR